MTAVVVEVAPGEDVDAYHRGEEIALELGAVSVRVSPEQARRLVELLRELL